MTERRREAGPGVRTERRKRKGKGKNLYFFSLILCFLTGFDKNFSSFSLLCPEFYVKVLFQQVFSDVFTLFRRKKQ
jgi:hypothetical protein